MPDPHDMLCRTLADPTRRALFERLCREGEKTVADLTFGAGVSQPVVSKHLALLKSAGLVSARQDGRNTHYTARLDGLAPLANWTTEMGRYWETRFDALEDLLNRMDQ